MTQSNRQHGLLSGCMDDEQEQLQQHIWSALRIPCTKMNAKNNDMVFQQQTSGIHWYSASFPNFWACWTHLSYQVLLENEMSNYTDQGRTQIFIKLSKWTYFIDKLNIWIPHRILYRSSNGLVESLFKIPLFCHRTIVSLDTLTRTLCHSEYSTLKTLKSAPNVIWPVCRLYKKTAKTWKLYIWSLRKTKNLTLK